MHGFCRLAVVLACLEFSVRPLPARDAWEPDATSRQQAALEREQMAAREPHAFCPAMADFRRTALSVEYPAGADKLPGYLYRPPGEGPFPAILWNHGSEKEPRAQPELARFYVSQGYVFFAPIRHGHNQAPGEYIGDLQDKLRSTEKSAAVREKKIVALHDRYNSDVVAAVDWLRQQPFVDRERMVMSGCSYGGIQTLIAAEKGLGLRAFIPFAPGAMSFANGALRERMLEAVRNARAPLFLLQAKNDYSTGPSELLGPVLKERGAPSRAKLYEPFGKTNQDGHGAFACRSLGIEVWGGDVVEFLDAALAAPRQD